MRVLRRAGWMMALVAAFAAVVFLVVSGLVPTVAPRSTPAPRAAATPGPRAHDLTRAAGDDYCGQNAVGTGRTLGSVEVRMGMRPTPEEAATLRDTDTFICVFTTGETLPFMVTYVAGRIVDIR